MPDTFVWRTGHSGAWNDPANWLALSGTRSVTKLERLRVLEGATAVDRPPGAGDDVVFPAFSVAGGQVTGGGMARTPSCCRRTAPSYNWLGPVRSIAYSANFWSVSRAPISCCPTRSSTPRLPMFPILAFLPYPMGQSGQIRTAGPTRPRSER